MRKYTKYDEPIITEDEQIQIVEWCRKNYKDFIITGYNRRAMQLDRPIDIPKCVWDIKTRIIEKENLQNEIQEPCMKDSIGYMQNDGKLHVHKDNNNNDKGLIHTRFNVYVQIPEKGGLPIYDGKLHKLKERTYICCRSGMDVHSCSIVKGNRERIILSYGYLLSQERVNNIVYDYD